MREKTEKALAAATEAATAAKIVLQGNEKSQAVVQATGQVEHCDSFVVSPYSNIQQIFYPVWESIQDVTHSQCMIILLEKWPSNKA